MATLARTVFSCLTLPLFVLLIISFDLLFDDKVISSWIAFGVWVTAFGLMSYVAFQRVREPSSHKPQCHCSVTGEELSELARMDLDVSDLHGRVDAEAVAGA